MAREIVAEFHTIAAAQEAEEAFIRQFSERKLPTDIPDYHLAEAKNIVELIVEAGLAGSNNKARELIKQGGVSFFLQGEAGEVQRITDTDFVVPAEGGAIIKVGRRQYIRIKTA
jgi:tyrosyl-tRNA synthetase